MRLPVQWPGRIRAAGAGPSGIVGHGSTLEPREHHPSQVQPGRHRQGPIPLSCDQRKPIGRGLARAMIAAATMPIGPSKAPAAAIPVALPVRSASCRSRSASCHAIGSFRIPLPPYGPAVGFVITTAIIREAAYSFEKAHCTRSVGQAANVHPFAGLPWLMIERRSF